jgi:prevent-host-death family protein
MKPVSIHEAKTNLSRLIARVEAGEEVILRRRQTPVAKLVAYEAPTVDRKPGTLKGQVGMADDFDAIPPDFDEYVA